MSLHKDKKTYWGLSRAVRKALSVSSQEHRRIVVLKKISEENLRKLQGSNLSEIVVLFTIY